ncbi:MAG: reverse transcriptase family protein [Gammaproteobacteria bacterium]|nr:reverse transcriptase family protein [Gammaproteobacteria bacterium]
MKPLLSLRDLAHRLGVRREQLCDIAFDIQSHYSEWTKTDAEKGKTRLFKVPDKELKFVQRRILHRLLNKYVLPGQAHGGVKGKSPRSNAAQHCGKPYVVTLDIRNFYPSVSHKQVEKMFRRELGCGRDTAWLLTRLTTIDGQLPQGAPTSTAVANLLLASTVDRPTYGLAKADGVNVTRFVDDFAFSGDEARSLINPTARSVSNVGLRTWRKPKKLKIMPSSKRQEVTGLTVNSPTGPSVPSEYRGRLRAAIHQLRSLTNAEAEKEIRSIRGKLNHVEQHNKGAARRLRRQFERVLQERDSHPSR